jgi:thiazole synthase
LALENFPTRRRCARRLPPPAPQIITVALRRVDLNAPTTRRTSCRPLIANKQFILPNTSGARTAEEAVRLAKLARAAGLEPWVKLELTPEPRYLLPDPIETLRAAEMLMKEGFVVLPYIQPIPCWPSAWKRSARPR